MFIESRIMVRTGLIGGIIILAGLISHNAKSTHAKIEPELTKNIQTKQTTSKPDSLSTLQNKSLDKEDESHDEYAGLRSQQVPIPGTNDLFIEAPEGEVMEVELYNMLGALIANSDSLSKKVETNLRKGIFFITITYNDGTKFVQKLINIED